MNRARPPEVIQAEITRTRGALEETLHAIERKLSPRQLMEQAMETVRDAGTQTRVVEMVREHPLPLALVGVGLGWFLMSTMRSQGGGYTEYSEYEPEETTGYGAGAGGYAAGSGGYAGYGAGAGTGYESAAGYGTETRRGGMFQSMRKRLSRAQEQAGHAAEGMSERASQAASQAQYQAERMTTAARRQMETARQQMGQMAGRSVEVFQERPLVVGLVALAVGAALGASLPRTRREGRLFGEAREDLVRSAREVGGEAMRRAQRVTSRAAEVAREEGGELVRKARDSGERLRDAVKDEAARQSEERFH